MKRCMKSVSKMMMKQKKAEIMPWKRPSRPKVVLIMKTAMMTLIVKTTLVKTLPMFEQLKRAMEHTIVIRLAERSTP